MEPLEKPYIIVAGSLNQDLFIQCDRLPHPGETHPVDNLSIASGGKGANQAVQAGRLGVPVKMFGAIGKDNAGKDLLRSLEQADVDTSLILEKEGNTGTCIINVLPDGTVYGNLVAGANGALSPCDLRSSQEEFKNAKYVVLQMEIPNDVNEKIMDLTHQGEGKIILNTAPAREVPDSFLSKADYLVLNENEAGFYLDRPVSLESALKDAKELQKRFGNKVLLTLGEDGSVLCTDTKEILIPARKTKAIDTTGAGDSYIGALAAQLIEGEDLEDAARFASTCSSLAVEKLGAQPAMPSLQEVVSVLEEEKKNK